MPFISDGGIRYSGDLAKAVQTYQTIVDNYPQIGWARNAQFQIGATYNKLSGGGNVQYLPPVAEAFRKYYTDYPEDEKAVYAYYYSAFALYRMGKWRESSDVFQALEKNHPDSDFAAQSLFRSGEAIFNLAQGGSSENKKAIYQEAMVKYDAVLGRYPTSDWVDAALYNKAWAIIHLSDMGDEYTRADALPFFERIVTDHPDGDFGAASQFTIGDYYYGEKQYDLAAASYQRFLDVFPEDRLKAKDRGLRRKAGVLLGHLSEIEAYEVYSRGEGLFDTEQYDEAIEIFQDVIERFPQSDQAVNAAVNIASAYMAQEEYRKAAEEFKRVVDQYGENSRFSPQVDFSKQQLQALEEARVL